MNFEFHPLANIFPLIEGQAYQELMADVLRHGIREPIWVYEGKILDGRNRYRAAQAMGVECPIQEYEGDDATGFVISLNLHRRHLSESQRAVVAAKLANLSHGQKTSDAQICATPVTQSDAAEMLNVSRRSVQAAKVIIDDAPNEVVKAVEAGYMSVNLASQVTTLPDADKAQIAAAPTELIVDVAREAVKNHRAIGTGENEWYTPAEYADMAREVMGSIDLDPASCEEANEVIQATKYFSKEDDGLTKTWKGNLWINPPYSRDLMPAFVDKLKQSFINGDVDSAILLSHNNTDTAWFHSLASISSAICFPKRRIKFYRGEEIAAPTNGQAFFYLGDNAGEFADVFGAVGFIVEPIPTEVIA